MSAKIHNISRNQKLFNNSRKNPPIVPLRNRELIPRHLTDNPQQQFLLVKEHVYIAYICHRGTRQHASKHSSEPSDGGK